MTTQDPPSLTTKSTRIAQLLREEIGSGQLPPGARLQQDDLARRFETSTTPVREALRQLEVDRLVRGAAHRGAAVAAPDADDLVSTYVILRELEPYAAQRAASRMTRRDFTDVERINDAFAGALAQHDRLNAWKLDQSFHFAIYDRCGLMRLSHEIRRLCFSFPWSSIRALSADSVNDPPAEHADMLRALVAGDEGVIKRLFAQHVCGGFMALAAELGEDSGIDRIGLEEFRLDTVPNSDRNRRPA